MSKSHILIVDDEEDIRLTIQAALEAEGFRTSSAATGAQALHAVGADTPDVVLLDIMMPDIDGYEICRRIKENRATRNVAVVFASALRKTSDKVTGLNIGADDYITKPYNMPELIAKIRAHCRIQEHQRRLEKLVDFAHAINLVELDAIAAAVSAKLDRLLDADRYSIFLVDEEAEVLRVLSHNHREEEMNDLSLPFSGSRIMLEALRSGELILVTDFPASQYGGGERREKYRDGFTLCVPLKATGRNLGVLNLSGNSKGYFNNLDYNTVELLAQMLSATLNNARITSALRKLATTDGLTRLYNHRHFYEILGLEFERSKRFGQPLSCVMMDLDYFKDINDTYGHPVGDTILKEIARRLKKHARKIDTLARYGGEEFAILLPQTGAESAKVMAERIRLDVERNPFPTEKGPLDVTISLGISDNAPEDVQNGGELVNRADKALYDAKRSGRNVTRVYGEGA